MKEQKPYDIFTFKPPHPSCYTRIRLFFHTALLLVESMLIRAKVNFCNERLRNQAKLNFPRQIRFLKSSESKVWVIQRENLTSVLPEAILRDKDLMLCSLHRYMNVLFPKDIVRVSFVREYTSLCLMPTNFMSDRRV